MNKHEIAVIIGLYRQGNSDYDIAQLVGVSVDEVAIILKPIKDKVKKNEIIYNYPLILN